MAWCVSLKCFAAEALDGLMSLVFCSALNCQWLQLLPWTWVISVFLPASAPSASLVGSGLSVWLEWWWLLATRACHWIRSRDRTVHKFVRERNALSRTDGQMPALCAGVSLSWFACSCCLLELVIQLTVVLVVRSSKIFNFWSSSDDTAVSVYCMPLFFPLGKGQARDVVCQLLSLVWHFPGIRPVHCHFSFIPILAPRTPLNREGVLVPRLRSRRIPSKHGLFSHIGGWPSIHFDRGSLFFNGH